MIGIGTIANTGAVIAGGLVGMLFKRGLSQRFQDTIMQAIGLAVMFFIFAAGVGAAARGAWRLHRWARPAAIAFELLVIVFAFSVIAGSLWLGLACLVTAIAVLLGFFLPAVVEAYNRALTD